MTVITANAQKRGYLCTGNNVNVRTGPSKSHPVIVYSGQKQQLNKGELVRYRGKTKNGFINVDFTINGTSEYWSLSGWVYAQYLRPVTLCPKCGGHGEIYGEYIDMCPRCNAKGYIR